MQDQEEVSVTGYLWDDFLPLYTRLRNGGFRHRALLRYLASLVAELTYFHVPQFEVDAKKRIKLIPCKEYEEILIERRPISVIVRGARRFDIEAPLDKEPVETFVINELSSGTSLALVVRVDRTLFVGVRGTVLAYRGDWKTNLNMRQTAFSDISVSSQGMRMNLSGVHSGFFLDGFSLAQKIGHEVHEHPTDRIVFCGHSLGGAIASIAGSIVNLAKQHYQVTKEPSLHTITFGAPRHANETFFYNAFSQYDASNVVRVGDLVPFLPPRKMGYADPLSPMFPSGLPWLPVYGDAGFIAGISRAVGFAWSAAKNHRIGAYRSDAADVAGITTNRRPLLDVKEIRAADLL